MYALFLLSCAGKTPAAVPADDPTLEDPTPEVQAPDTEFHSSHMSTHYTLLTSARDAVIRGDLEGSKEPLGWLADHEIHQTIPVEMVPYVHEMRGAARVAREATTVEAAAQGVATVAVICGECHQKMGVGPSFAEETALPDRGGVNWHMARHRWATDRLWEGMIQPSDTHWNLGVSALQEDPLKQEELHAGMEMSEDEAAVAEWLHTMGEFGMHMNESRSRAAYYGELLSNCSSCHSTIGKGPQNTTPD